MVLCLCVMTWPYCAWVVSLATRRLIRVADHGVQRPWLGVDCGRVDQEKIRNEMVSLTSWNLPNTSLADGETRRLFLPCTHLRVFLRSSPQKRPSSLHQQHIADKSIMRSPHMASGEVQMHGRVSMMHWEYSLALHIAVYAPQLSQFQSSADQTFKGAEPD